MVNARRIADGAVTDGVRYDLFNLGRAIPQHIKRCRNRLVDDFEVAASSELLEFHQRKVRLDPRGVTIHHEADRAGWRDDGNLRVAVSVLFAKLQRIVPRLFGQLHKPCVWAIGLIKRHWLDVERIVAVGLAVGCVAVVGDDAKHVLGVPLVAGEWPQLTRHFGRCRIRHTGHDRCQRSGQRTAFVAVVAQPHVHQQTTDVGIAKAQRAEIIGILRDLLRWELRHHNRDLERHRPETGRVHVVFNLKLPT